MAQNKARRKPPAVYAVDFSDINWSSQSAVLHRRYGKNIRLSGRNCVAERVNPLLWERYHHHPDHGVVMTAEPVPVGGMFQVTVLEKVERWSGALVRVVLGH